MMVLLMDELLGISNKRLKYIFKGQSDDVASSSNTDSEEEKPADDVISLSDITSGEDDVILCAPDTKGSFPTFAFADRYIFNFQRKLNTKNDPLKERKAEKSSNRQRKRKRALKRKRRRKKSS